ncbi:MAG: hypothetical protein IIX02_03175 [Clostridia bacterium]|nr:hypothetical protein [Clostridia bacterium]
MKKLIKTLKTTIILGEGEFSGGGNTKIIEGLATTVQVTKAGLPEKNSAEVRIQGLKLSDMEQLTFLSFLPGEYRKNHILIEAGDKGEELSVVFKGDITAASADFSTAPDVTMKFNALTAGWSVLIADSPTSVQGEATAESLISQFATQAGFNFINNGVTESVKNATFNGSPVQKAQQVADEVGCELLMDDETWTIQPWDKPRGDAVLLKADSGMIGYPSFTQDGISCECFYNPRLQLGGQIKIESIVPRASGYWKITKLSHDLAAYTNGRWVSRIDGMYLPENAEEESGADNE